MTSYLLYHILDLQLRGGNARVDSQNVLDVIPSSRRESRKNT
ncbi:hypothetical protein [Rickettsia endosymbiont of Orchestes rusci]